ncbi:MAG: hypothetical protein ACI8XB_000999 [Patiriisocius sp.]|jgi:hypothetical protein
MANYFHLYGFVSFFAEVKLLVESRFQHLGLRDIDQSNFESVALTIFKYQADNCLIYSEFLRHMKVDPMSVNTLADIPFLPISFFKSHQVLSQKEEASVIFKSSGTSNQVRSQHFVSDISVYEQSFMTAFVRLYGPVKDYCVLGLLPSYLEQGESSLVYMVDHLINNSESKDSGFYLNDYKSLFDILEKQKTDGVKTILFGVTYALLEMAEQFPINFKDLIIIETGGMKGRRKEIIRTELHQILFNAYESKYIHSEYGMTELLSQAYSADDELFVCPPWMKVKITDLHDPGKPVRNNKTGRINVIDLANINSCSFIATNDLGSAHENGKFKVLGRIDNSDVRGCNLLTFG